MFAGFVKHARPSGELNYASLESGCCWMLTMELLLQKLGPERTDVLNKAVHRRRLNDLLACVRGV